MESLIVKRSLVVDGTKTSVSLEDAFWDAFKEMAVSRRMSVSDLASEINKTRTHSNLSSALRLAVFAHFDRRAGEREAA